jgi:outer membrane protein, multidrug efflux system
MTTKKNREAAPGAMVSRRIRTAKAVSLASLLALAGCAVGPNYRRPEIETPASFNERMPPSTRPVASRDVSLADWWRVFGDRQLNSLVDRAVEQNLDLRIAAMRIVEARAVLGVNRSLLLPAIDGTGGYNRSRRSLNSGFGGRGGTGGVIDNGGFDRETDLYSAGFEANWEIDVFGGLRRGVEAARAEFQAAVENRRDVLVSLLADVARNYIELRGAQRQLDIVRKNLQTQEQTLGLTRSRFEAGLTSDLDVARAEAQASTTRAQIPPLEDQIRRSIRRLSVLLGEQPEALLTELAAPAPIPMPRGSVSSVAFGAPAELLRRRPDVRRAERTLAANVARVGVAIADLFPRFSLTGDFGWQAENTKDLDSSDSIAWSVGPAVRWQLLNFGRVTSNIEANRARAEQALTAYEQTVLIALEEAENAIGSYRREGQRRDALANAVAASQRAVDLADQLYRQGLTAFQDVLDAQRRLLEAESQFITSEQTVSTNLVQVYRALGGGWDPERRPPSAGPVIRVP